MVKLLRRLHLIGIGGTGMRPLAEIARHQGYEVSGSDQGLSGNTDKLRALGIDVKIQHSPQHIPELACRVVVSSAIKADNPELSEAKRRGLEILHRSDLLLELMQGKKAICVSGTHGKTSTTAMLAFMLDEMGLKPSAAIGGELLDRARSSLSGDGAYFVAECDESDGSFTKYEPFLSIVTNIDRDHLDHYKDLEGIKDAFLTFLQKTHPDGCAILGWDNAVLQDVAQHYSGPKLTFGTRIGSEVRGRNFKSEGPIFSYDAIVEKLMVHGSAQLVGRHNLQNILCCLAVAKVLSLDIAAAAAALERYPGVGRRFSLMGRVGQVKIYDDYAHNPGKIRSCIEGARDAFPKERLIVIFQPHRYSRLETMYNDFMSAFAAADEVFVLPVYAAGESSDADYSPARLAKDMQVASAKPVWPYDHAQLAKELQKTSRPTVLITIGAGDVWRLSLEWKDYLHEQEAQKDDTSRQSKT